MGNDNMNDQQVNPTPGAEEEKETEGEQANPAGTGDEEGPIEGNS